MATSSPVEILVPKNDKEKKGQKPGHVQSQGKTQERERERERKEKKRKMKETCRCTGELTRSCVS